MHHFPPDYFIQKLLDLGRQVRSAILSARVKNPDFASISKVASADTIYQIDTHVEPIIVQFCDHWSKEIPLVLIAEGISDESQVPAVEDKIVFPRGTREQDARIRILCDPIDGTRGLMYDKRSAWFLAGIAPNKGDSTPLSAIEIAVQVELPTTKQSASDLLWAARGQGAKAIREEVRGTVFQKSHDLSLRPSQAGNIDHGFASIANFFPGAKELTSRLMEIIADACLPSAPGTGDRGIVFDDQYISTGGQFYELITGHDRFIADLRPILHKIRRMPPGLCAHPYDVVTALIATEAGVLITDGLGNPLDGPLDTTTPLAWAGYANPALRTRIEPVMINTLHTWLKGL